MKPIFASLLLAVLSSTAYSAEKVVICFDSWPPAKITGAQAKPDRHGFIVDMLRKIYEKHGFQVEMQAMPYMRAIAEVEQGRCDLEPATTLMISKVGLFAKTPSYVSQYVFFTPKGSTFQYSGVASLKNLKLGTVVGYDYSSMDSEFQKYITAAGPFVSSLAGLGAVDRTFKKISLGWLDLFAEDINVGQYIILQQGLGQKLQVSSPLPNTLKLYPMFSPAHPAKSAKLIRIFETEMQLNKSLINTYITTYGIKPN
jgi:polar amino acid transport system substrate-binding protein